MDDVILLFDKSCPYTTGVYIERAAVKTGYAVSKTRPDDGDRGKACILIDDSSHWDDGLAWIETYPRRCFWAIDTHTAWERCLEIARHFPLVYAAQHDGTEALKAKGINAHWLPVAAEPDGWHADRGVERDIDVAFVGNARYPERCAVLEMVDAAFDNFVIDTSGDPARIGEIYSRAKLVINHSVRNDLNMRIFEAASCGAGIVTNTIPASQYPGLFALRWEYGNGIDAVTAISNALAAPQAIAGNARFNAELIRNRHTYAHRLQTMLAGLAQLS